MSRTGPRPSSSPSSACCGFPRSSTPHTPVRRPLRGAPSPRSPALEASVERDQPHVGLQLARDRGPCHREEIELIPPANPCPEIDASGARPACGPPAPRTAALGRAARAAARDPRSGANASGGCRESASRSGPRAPGSHELAAVGAVHIDRKAVAVSQRPRQLGSLASSRFGVSVVVSSAAPNP